MKRPRTTLLALLLVAAGLAACGIPGGQLPGETDDPRVATGETTLTGTVGGIDSADRVTMDVSGTFAVLCSAGVSVEVDPVSGPNFDVTCDLLSFGLVFDGDVIIVTAPAPNTAYTLKIVD